MREIPADLPADLAPLFWLVGVWEGSGVIDYPVGDNTVSAEFFQRTSFSHDGGGYLNSSSRAWITRGSETEYLVAETGYWRLARPLGDSDAGPGLLPAREAAVIRTPDDVEAFRTETGGYPLEISVAHSDGSLELYLGEVRGARVEVGTDAVVRGAGSKEYTASTRLYGLVESHLLWAWDIAALGSPLASHASARLARVS